jgi:hypothetical protein
MPSLDPRIREAVKHFWTTRRRQASSQGGASGARDMGARAAVTGGAQMDGFVGLVHDLLLENGAPQAGIHLTRHLELPGWYRAEKSWDLIVVIRDELIAALEFKSQVGPSFGNNFNNRTEEALGSATDLWAAFREGAFRPSGRPWLGYLMMLEECHRSTSPIAVREPHFDVFIEFKSASYERRYSLLIEKLLRDRLYDGGCFLLSCDTSADSGEYKEPNPELSFARFITPLLARVQTEVRLGE